MGCGASREDATSTSANVRTTSLPRTRSTEIPAITSQTAINPRLSATTSQQQNVTSNVSTPRSSTHSGRRRSQRPVSLTEHYNAPLQAPKPWKSKDRSWTRAQIRREREEFFETRVTGRKETWAALKQAAECLREGDIADAQGILDAVGITLPSGRLEEGGYDESGVLYRLPQPILSDPVNVLDDDGETVVSNDEMKKKLDDDDVAVTDTGALPTDSEKIDKGKEAIEKDALKIKCRLSDRGGPDSIVLVGASQPVNVLVRRLRSEVGIEPSVKVLIAYLGHILDENKSLEEQGWAQGHVVQALITGFP